MRVLLAHPGTQHAFRLARELEMRDLLGEFWTGIGFAKGSLLGAAAGFARRWRPLAGLGSRIAAGVSAEHLHNVPLNELHALWKLRRGEDSHCVLHRRNERFQRSVPTKSLARMDAIIGFDTSSWILAERARQVSCPFILDRSIAHPTFVARNLVDIYRQYPRWATVQEARPIFVANAEDAEHTNAQTIVVGSSFARDTLIAAGIASAKIRINAYGVDWETFGTSKTSDETESNRPIRFLFVGSMIARKGLPVLLDAWERLAPHDAELWLVGSCDAPTRSLIPALPGLRVFGRVAHRELPSIYAKADVLVLPSIVEGFSLVLLEALAAGLPIIATPNTGATDLLVSSTLGKTVPPASVDALMAALAAFAANRPNRSDVRAAAAPLRSMYSWRGYGDRWADLLKETAAL